MPSVPIIYTLLSNKEYDLKVQFDQIAIKPKQENIYVRKQLQAISNRHRIFREC